MASERDIPFGTRLRSVREAAGLTQEALAERAGLSLNAVSALERGNRLHPYPSTVRAIADALRLSETDRTDLASAARRPGVAGSSQARSGSTLPAQLSPLVGRSAEAATAAALVRHADLRLLTLTGPGGVGKTRLALQVAEEVAHDFSDGVTLVRLAPIVDPALVADTIVQALDMRPAGAASAEELLVGFLRARASLLVLDNFEQVAPAAPVVQGLLTACPRLRVMVTSRSPLRVEGEQEFPVPPLAFPDPQAVGATVVDVAASPAVILFVARARAVDPAYRLTEVNAPIVAEICARLDGLPLAIELAAARAKLLPPAALLARLSNRMDLLTGGGPDRPTRQQTLRGAIAWSYDLLEPDEQKLYRRLSVCAGSWTIETADAVAGSPGSGELELPALDGLGRLIDHSLVRRIDGSDGEPRFAMLETIREFGLGQLSGSGEADEARQRHAAHFLALAEVAVRALTGPGQGAWLDRLEADHVNLRAALAWAIERDAESAMRLGAALWRFWWQRGHLSEGRRWLERALDEDDGVAPALRLQALYGAGSLADVQGDFAVAERWHEEELALARRIDDEAAVARALNGLGNAASGRGDTTRAISLFEEVLSLGRRLADRFWIANGAMNLGTAVAREGDLERGQSLLEEALALNRDRGHVVSIVYGLTHLGAITLALGDRARAVGLLRESLTKASEIELKTALTEVLVHIAHDAAATGHPERAARLLGAAEALREAVGAVFDPLLPAEHDSAVAHARRALGDTAFMAAWHAGRVLSLREAEAEALTETMS